MALRDQVVCELCELTMQKELRTLYQGPHPLNGY